MKYTTQRKKIPLERLVFFVVLFHLCQKPRKEKLKRKNKTLPKKFIVINQKICEARNKSAILLIEMV
jgi:hypothetical protein